MKKSLEMYLWAALAFAFVLGLIVADVTNNVTHAQADQTIQTVGSLAPVNFKDGDVNCSYWPVLSPPYTMSNTPKPASSLMIFKNGELMCQVGQACTASGLNQGDYALTTAGGVSTVTFMVQLDPPSATDTGDMLDCRYRY